MSLILRLTCIAAVLGVGPFALGGCGGSGITMEQSRTQANAICEEADREVEKLGSASRLTEAEEAAAALQAGDRREIALAASDYTSAIGEAQSVAPDLEIAECNRFGLPAGN